MEPKKRPTTGQIYLDAFEKETHPVEVEELRQRFHKNYEKNIYECVENGKKMFDGDFFVHVETKRERLTPNVIRNYFVARRSCSRPWYDQTIYKYHRNEDRIEFLWVIPSKPTCIEFREHIMEIPSEARDLLQFILDYYDGTLMRKCLQLNNEFSEPQLIN